MYFWFVGCFFLMLAFADRGTDKLQAIIDEDQDHREKFASDNQAILTAKKRVKKSSKKLIANIRSFAEALDQGIAYLSGSESNEEAGLSTTDYSTCSELDSDFPSDDERSKYGINAIPKPYY